MSPLSLSPEEKDARRERIAQLRQQGYSYEDIAAAMKLSVSTVKAYAQPQRRESDEILRQRRRIYELRDQGLSVSEIADQVNLSKQRVQQIVSSRPSQADRKYRPSSEPKRTITISADGLDWLRRTAAEFGFRRTRGPHGSSDGDVNQLILALQHGDLEIVPTTKNKSS